MCERSDEPIDLCDDFSPFFEEESMPESIVHAQLVRYLVAVLTWLFRDSLCAICENFAFYPPLEQSGPPVAPDIAVMKGVALRPLTSWRIGTTGPAPNVVFEICQPRPGKRTSKRSLLPMPTWASASILPMTPIPVRCPSRPPGASSAGGSTRWYSA